MYIGLFLNLLLNSQIIYLNFLYVNYTFKLIYTCIIFIWK